MMNIITPGVMASHSLAPVKSLILDAGTGRPELDRSLEVCVHPQPLEPAWNPRQRLEAADGRRSRTLSTVGLVFANSALLLRDKS